MASENPLHPTTDSVARAGSGTYENPVQNARATYADKNTKGPRIYIPGVSQSSTQKRVRVKNLSDDYNQDEIEDGVETPRQTRVANRGLGQKVEGTIRLLAIRARLTPVVAGISFIAFFFYIIQLILAVVAFTGLGIAILLESAGGSSGTEIVAALSSQLLNLDFSVGLLLFFAFSFLIFAVYLIEILWATIILKAALVHPWFGSGATFKLGAIVLMLTSSFIPLLNMFPLFWLWMFAVLLNPK